MYTFIPIYVNIHCIDKVSNTIADVGSSILRHVQHRFGLYTITN
jgi:hypothetical protein